MKSRHWTLERTGGAGALREATPGQTVRLAGRWEAVEGVSGRGMLSDETGRAVVLLAKVPSGPRPASHDLVVVQGLWTGEVVEAAEVAVLHRSSGLPPWRGGRGHLPGHLRAMAEARRRLTGAVRSFFDARGFLEVETPVLLAAPALQSHIEELTTRCRRPDGPARRLFLSTSPEHAMKRLLAAGLERLYQMAPFFRDGELTDRHAPAFSGLEWYEAYTDYRQCMTTTEALVAHLAEAVVGSLRITYRGEALDLTPPWERLTVAEAFERTVRVGLDPQEPAEAFRTGLQERGLAVGPEDDWDACFFKAYIERVEPTLGRGRPTLLADWPASQAAMARPSAADPRWSERFELYAAGLELGNAFSELTDEAEQRMRFEAVAAERPGQEPDLRLLEAMAYGIPPASGMALGLDRLLMLLTDAPAIKEVLLFPPHYEWAD